MKRSKPLRQRRKEGPDRVREQRPSWAEALVSGSRGMHRGTYAGTTSGAPVAKEEPLQHRGYMEAVRELGYCMRCRKFCRPQFCHRDCGKGTGLKTDCREGWPGCPECHYLVGSTGQYSKEQRRALELELGWRTRQAVRAAGTWPARLPAWNEQPTGGTQ